MARSVESLVEEMIEQAYADEGMEVCVSSALGLTVAEAHLHAHTGHDCACPKGAGQAGDILSGICPST